MAKLGFRARRKLVPLADQAAGSCSGLAPALLLSLGNSVAKLMVCILPSGYVKIAIENGHL
jgi:hypothetical protein